MSGTSPGAEQTGAASQTNLVKRDGTASRAITRRVLLRGGAVAAGGALTGAAATRAVDRASSRGGAASPAGGPSPAPDGSSTAEGSAEGVRIALHGTQQIPFHGAHQAGVLTSQQAYGAFVGLNLRPGTGPDRIRTLLRMLTDDAARLTQGRPPLGALEDDLARLPARLTVTIGFGAGLFAALGRRDAVPPELARLPHFSTDLLEPRWGQTDLVLQICSDDPVGRAYAQRRLVRDAAAFTVPAWVQAGFVNAAGTEAPGTTARNLMGMRDGTANETDPAAAADVVWCTDPTYPWLVGGSHLVIRRMSIDLAAWDDLEVSAKEEAFGRRVQDGSPLTGGRERDAVDRLAKTSDGFPVINPAAHAARAQARTAGERMHRRAYNYDVGVRADGTPDAGLIFACYQKDVRESFIPVQRRLAESDLLNIWVRHIGSASYAVAPGAPQGGYLGQPLLEG